MHAHDQDAQVRPKAADHDNHAGLPAPPQMWRQDTPRPAALSVPGLPPQTWYLFVKGVLEFVIAVVLLVLSAPLILVTALVVKLTSPGPAFYSQVRLGKHGRAFRLHKLRTMYH